MFAKSKRPPIMESLSQVVSPCVFAMSDPSETHKTGGRLSCRLLGSGKSNVAMGGNRRSDAHRFQCVLKNLKRTLTVFTGLACMPLDPATTQTIEHGTSSHMGMAVGCHPLSTPLPFHLDIFPQHPHIAAVHNVCLLYTSDAADE